MDVYAAKLAAARGVDRVTVRRLNAANTRMIRDRPFARDVVYVVKSAYVANLRVLLAKSGQDWKNLMVFSDVEWDTGVPPTEYARVYVPHVVADEGAWLDVHGKSAKPPSMSHTDIVARWFGWRCGTFVRCGRGDDHVYRKVRCNPQPCNCTPTACAATDPVPRAGGAGGAAHAAQAADMSVVRVSGLVFRAIDDARKIRTQFDLAAQDANVYGEAFDTKGSARLHLGAYIDGRRSLARTMRAIDTALLDACPRCGATDVDTYDGDVRCEACDVTTTLDDMSLADKRDALIRAGRLREAARIRVVYLPHPLGAKHIAIALDAVCWTCSAPMGRDRRCSDPACRAPARGREAITWERKREILANAGCAEYAMISCYLTIPPLTIRPAANAGDQSPDLARAYERIVAHIMRGPNLAAPKAYVMGLGRLHATLCMHLCRSLSGKDGLPRNTILGKRLDNSARGVIVGASDQPFDVVGVPRRVADTLRVTTTATTINLPTLLAAADAGRLFFAGEDSPASATDVLLGASYDRCLADDDLVVVNRQPTLTENGILAFRALVHDDHAIKLNPAMVSTFGGDFDGDEVNLFVFGDDAARADMTALMRADRADRVKPVQDTIVGAYLMTRAGVRVPRIVAMRCALAVADAGALPHWPFPRGSDPIDGRVLFETLLLHDGPDKLVHDVSYPATADTVRKIIPRAIERHPRYTGQPRTANAAVVRYLRRLQLAMDVWMTHAAISVGLPDFDLRAVNAAAAAANDRWLAEIRPDDRQDVKRYVAWFSDAFESFDDAAPLVAMIKSGAKGQWKNAMDMLASLAHVRGNGGWVDVFVRESYYTGLSPTNLPHQYSVSWEGIVYTGAGTSAEGYAARMINMSSQGMRVDYRGYIRMGNIVITHVRVRRAG